MNNLEMNRTKTFLIDKTNLSLGKKKMDKIKIKVVVNYNSIIHVFLYPLDTVESFHMRLTTKILGNPWYVFLSFDSEEKLRKILQPPPSTLRHTPKTPQFIEKPRKVQLDVFDASVFIVSNRKNTLEDTYRLTLAELAKIEIPNRKIPTRQSFANEWYRVSNKFFKDKKFVEDIREFTRDQETKVYTLSEIDNNVIRDLDDAAKNTNSLLQNTWKKTNRWKDALKNIKEHPSKTSNVIIREMDLIFQFQYKKHLPLIHIFNDIVASSEIPISVYYGPYGTRMAQQQKIWKIYDRYSYVEKDFEIINVLGNEYDKSTGLLSGINRTGSTSIIQNVDTILFYISHLDRPLDLLDVKNHYSYGAIYIDPLTTHIVVTIHWKKYTSDIYLIKEKIKKFLPFADLELASDPIQSNVFASFFQVYPNDEYDRNTFSDIITNSKQFWGTSYILEKEWRIRDEGKGLKSKKKDEEGKGLKSKKKDEEGKETEPKFEIRIINPNPIESSHGFYENFSLTIRSGIAHGNDIEMREMPTKILDKFSRGSLYIQCSITRARNLNEVFRIHYICALMLAVYAKTRQEIVDEYTSFIPNFVEENKEAIKIEREDVIKKGKTTLGRLQSKDTKLFGGNYSRICAGGKQPQVFDKESDIDPKWNKLQYLPPNLLSSFPGYKSHWYTCGQYQHIGLVDQYKKETLAVPVPCCYTTEQVDEINTILNTMEQRQKTRQKEKASITHVLQKGKVVTGGSSGLLLDEMEAFLAPFSNDKKSSNPTQKPEGHFVRVGFVPGPNSVLYCLFAAFVPGFVSAGIREQTSLVEFYRYILTNNKKGVSFSICKQENPNMSVELLEELARNPKEILHPARYRRWLEETFGCNIFVFAQTEDDKNILDLGDYKDGYYQYFHTGNGGRRSVMLYTHPDHLHTEIIVKKGSSKLEDQYVYGDNLTMYLYESMRYLHKQRIIQPIGREVFEIAYVFPLEYIDTNLFNDITEQIIDESGKTRAFTVEWIEEGKKMIVGIQTTPIPPLNKPTSNHPQLRQTRSDIVTKALRRYGWRINKQFVPEGSNQLAGIFITKSYKDSDTKSKNDEFIFTYNFFIPLIPRKIIPDEEATSDIGGFSLDFLVSELTTRQHNQRIARLYMENVFYRFSLYLIRQAKIKKREPISYVRNRSRHVSIVEDFLNHHTVVTENHHYNYNNIVKHVFLDEQDNEGNFITTDGKLIIDQLDLKEKIKYMLEIELQTAPRRLIRYSENPLYRQFFVYPEDFTYRQDQSILDNREALNNIIQTRFNNYNVVRDLDVSYSRFTEPYFFESPRIFNRLALIQNCVNKEQALQVGRDWLKYGINYSWQYRTSQIVDIIPFDIEKERYIEMVQNGIYLNFVPKLGKSIKLEKGDLNIPWIFSYENNEKSDSVYAAILFFDETSLAYEDLTENITFDSKIGNDVIEDEDKYYKNINTKNMVNLKSRLKQDGIDWVTGRRKKEKRKESSEESSSSSSDDDEEEDEIVDDEEEEDDEEDEDEEEEDEDDEDEEEEEDKDER